MTDVDPDTSGASRTTVTEHPQATAAHEGTGPRQDDMTRAHEDTTRAHEGTGPRQDDTTRAHVDTTRAHEGTAPRQDDTTRAHVDTTRAHQDTAPRHEDTAAGHEDSAVSPSRESVAPEHGHDPTPAHAHASRSDNSAAAGDGGSGIGPDRARELRQRWSEVKGEFVDNPRSAASKARDVAAEVLDELERALRTQHGALGESLGADPETEDLRVAINRYQQFSERLMSF